MSIPPLTVWKRIYLDPLRKIIESAIVRAGLMHVSLQVMHRPRVYESHACKEINRHILPISGFRLIRTIYVEPLFTFFNLDRGVKREKEDR